MRVRRIVVLVGVVGLVIAAPAAARLTERHICKVYRCRTLAGSGKVRVVHATARRPRPQQPVALAFAEWLPTARVTILSEDELFEGALSHFAIAGPFVAFAASEAHEPARFSEHVVLLNVKTRLTRKTSVESFPVSAPGIVQVVVTPAGSVGWMKEGVFSNPTVLPPRPEVSGRAIYALPAAKEEVLAAYSLGIVPLSLAATAGHIYWLEGGIPRTYAVP